jgi:hypothetical protein
MADGSFPQPPLGYTALRRYLRSGLSTQARQVWWPSLPRVPDGEGINAFAGSELATNRYKWANADVVMTKDRSLNEKVTFILQLIVNQFQLFDQQLVATLTRILLIELNEISTVFSVLYDVISRADWYIAPDAASHRIRFEVFRQLLERNNSRFYNDLMQISAIDDDHLDMIFTNLFVDILPEDSVKRLV